MSSRASYPHADLDTAEYDADEPDELFAGEPISPQHARRGSSMLSAMIAIVLLSGCGFVVLETRALWEPWLPAGLPALSSFVAPNPEAPADHQAAVAAGAPAFEPPVPVREVAEAPPIEVGTPVPSAPAATSDEATSSQAASAEAASDADKPAAPLPPPAVDASDRYQTRAMAVGLHPGLSRVLLTRMSAADYRNADVAIKKALAETRDGDVLVWPQGSGAKTALFEVRFVKSAARDCRRYVVTITKDRWSTTAQPMEKCGLSAPG